MADAEAKGNQYLAEARKKSRSVQGFLSGLVGGGSRQDEAIELYVRAANSFKMAKKWNEAGSAFYEAAQLHQKSEYKHDSGVCYIDAANCYRKVDPQKALNCLQKVIEIYTDMGRFTMAAKHHITVAEIYEKECVDIGKACLHYEQAADYYMGEQSTASANKCLLIVARYAAQLEQYQKAINIYESVANTAIESSLLKYSAKDYYFRAALCHLCIDQLNAQLAVKRYEEMYPQFTDCRECKLLKQLFERLEENDVDGYTYTIQQYDSISRLDSWFTNMLLKVKKQMSEEPDMK